MTPPSSGGTWRDEAVRHHRELRNELDRVKYRTTRLFELYETGELGKAALREHMAKLSAEWDRVQAALAAMSASHQLDYCRWHELLNNMKDC